MQKTDKPANQAPPAETPAQSPDKPAPAKKKLTLDVTDVAEVLERKISP